MSHQKKNKAKTKNVDMGQKNSLLLNINYLENDSENMHNNEITIKNKLSKKKISFSNDENKKITSALNDFESLSSKVNSTNFNDKKTIISDVTPKNNNALIIYDEIKSNIEKFISDYINEKINISSVLKEILNAIKIIINDSLENKTNNSSTKTNKNFLFLTEDNEAVKNTNKNNSNFELNINSKIVFLLKIRKLNEKIKKLQEEINFYKTFIKFPKKTKKGQNFIDVFKREFLEQKEKNKTNEFKYLFYIGEQEKKINSLEKQLNKKEKENLPFETIKLIRCFPHFRQYDFKDNKSISLFQQFQQEKKTNKISNKINSKPNKHLSYSAKHKKKFYNKNSFNINKLLLTNSDIDGIKKNTKKIKNENARNNNRIKNYNISLNNENNFSNNEEENNINNSTLKCKTNRKKKDKNNLYELIKDYHPKTILDNKKEFFLAHPTVNMASYVKKNELKYNGIPQKVIKLKVHKSIEKDLMINFPSSLNETLLNLEKLRKYKHVHTDDD